MPYTIVGTGMGLGGVLALSGEAASGHIDPITIITSAGVCGLIAWVLLQSQIKRSQHDAEARDNSEKQLVELVRETVGSQKESNIQIAKNSSAIEKLTQAMSESIHAQNETSQMTRTLVDIMRQRPCVSERKDNK